MSVIDEIKNKAKANKKTVVLPETTDMRTLTAAAEVISEGIADIILVGKEDEIKAKAEAEGLDLSKASFVDPENCDHLNTYIESLCEARKSKGLLPEDAKEILLSNPLFFGATMVRVGDADGMVAGAINSSANVLRAALQVVKTAPGTEIVSAFMLMDTQAKDMGENGCFVFADCGLNQNPNPEQLAAIASSSAKTFEQLIGATPRVAMLSHSTCGSAKHDDVTKVVEATNIAKEKYPQYLICGELQLDAAIVPEVAASKAPRSEVAGKANVLVFPDLDAGNIGYKFLPDKVDTSGEGIFDETKDFSNVPKWKQTLSLIILLLTLLGMIFEDQIGIKLCVIGCVGALALIVTGVISEKDALLSIDLKTIFLFGGTLSLASALEATGAGELIADKVIGMLGDNPSPYILTFVIFMLCCIMTNFMSNTATTALMAPIGVSIAQGMGADPSAVLMACVIGGSCAFATPIGMPANTMVVTAGGYTFKDYAKAGIPMIVVATIVSMILLPIFYPFFP